MAGVLPAIDEAIEAAPPADLFESHLRVILAGLAAQRDVSASTRT